MAHPREDRASRPPRRRAPKVPRNGANGSDAASGQSQRAKSWDGKIPPGLIARLEALLRPRMERSLLSPWILPGRHRRQAATIDSYPLHPPGVMPKDGDGPKMAMDDATSAVLDWAGSSPFSSAFQEGVTFLGYAYLAELAQRPEYRRAVEVLSKQMTRKWIKLNSKSGGEDKEEKIKQLDNEIKRVKLRKVFQKAFAHGRYFGRAHIYADLRDSAGNGRPASENREELATPITDADGLPLPAKVVKGSLRGFKTVEAVWTYPIDYNSADPLRDDWYNPTRWFVMGKEVHASRILMLVPSEVPDLLKPAYSFGGLALTQMGKPYVDNWLRTRQSVADLLHAFSVFVLKTPLDVLLQMDGEKLIERVKLFNTWRDNTATFLVDKDTEEFDNVAAPLGGVHELQSQVQEHMAAVWGIPIVIYLGVQPTGLNASSEGEIRTFYDNVLAMQEDEGSDPLRQCIQLCQMNVWGEVDPDIDFAWVPLWSLDEKSVADKRKTEAETDVAYIDAGVLAPPEVRRRLAADAESPYNSIDEESVPINPEDVPNLKEEEEQGLEPHGQEHGEGESEDALDDETDDMFPRIDRGRGPRTNGGNRDRLIMMRGGDVILERGRDRDRGSAGRERGRTAERRLGEIDAEDEWKESDHPRGQPANAGQFSSGGGGGTRGGEEKGATGVPRGQAGGKEKHWDIDEYRDKIKENLSHSEPGNQNQPSNDLHALYDLARKSEPVFKMSIDDFAAATGGTAAYTPPQYAEPNTILKSMGSAKRKLSDVGVDGQPERLKDIVRGTLVYQSTTEARAAAVKFMQEQGAQILRCKDRFSEPAAGYRDILINFRLEGGLIAEMQFNTPTMIEVKNGEGHRMYEELREIVKLGDHVDTIQRLKDDSLAVYERAYEKDGNTLWK